MNLSDHEMEYNKSDVQGSGTWLLIAIAITLLFALIMTSYNYYNLKANAGINYV